jgi:hypothetical protein
MHFATRPAPPTSAADRLIDLLSERQHLRPHEGVATATAHAASLLGIASEVAAKAIEQLGLDGARAVGRLRRTELMQLGRAVYRGHSPKAIALWRKVLDLRGADPIGLSALADLHEQAGEWRELTEIIGKA